MRAIFEVSAKVLAMLAFACWSAPALAFPTDPQEWLVSPPIHTAPCDRALAAEWLGKMKAAPAYETLIALCDDPDGGVRYSAVTALGQLGDPRATATLARLAADPRQEKLDGARTFTWREFYWLPNRGEAMWPKPRLLYDVRHQAQGALMELRPEHAGGAPREPVEAIAELTALLKTDLSEWEDYHVAWKPFHVISKVKSGHASAVVLVEALGHGILDSDVAEALAARTDSAEIMALLKPLLARPDLKPETLATYLKLVQRHQPAAAPALARRLLERMKTADDRTWANFRHTIGGVLLVTLRPEDLPILDRLAHHLGAAAASAEAAAKEKRFAPAVITIGGRRVGESRHPGPETDESVRASDKAKARAREENHRRDEVLQIKEEILGHPPAKAAMTKRELLQLDAARLTAEPRPKTVETLLTALQQPRGRDGSMEESEVYQAAHQLGVLRERAAVPALLTLVDSEMIGGYGGDISASTPGMAAWALIQIADPASIPELRKRAERSPAEFEKNRCTEALIAYGALAGEEAIPALTKVLKMPPRAGYAKDEWRMAVTSRMFGYTVGYTHELWRKQTRVVPNLSWPQAAAACALSRIHSPRAREALRSCLSDAAGPQRLDEDIVEALFNAIPDDLNAWSRNVLATPEGENAWESNSLRTAAVAVQLHFFPQQSAELVRSILAEKAHPLRASVMTLMRAQSFKDDGVTTALATLLDDPLPEAVKQRRKHFYRRLETIDAIGFQGGPVAVAVLLRVAAP